MNNNTITKAEILWTRKCPLRCSYCAMATGQTNEKSVRYWYKVAKQLKNLNCRFAAFYGAEPLADAENLIKLGKVLKRFSKLGIDTTLITSGVVPHLRERLQYLHDMGLRSLTMSYDIQPLDSSSAAKSAQALETLLWFKSLGVRDVAAVTTLTKTNFMYLPEHIRQMTEMGIWTFFDLIHDDRGQPGSKCKHTSTTQELLFDDKTYPELYSVLNEVARLKQSGALCNSSLPFIDLLKENDFQHIRKYDWNCAADEVFPGWITIDYNGQVYPCDDFHCSEVSFSADRISKEFDNFRDAYKRLVQEKCPGCLWNTHIDANFIKAGVLKGYGVEDAKNGNA